MEKMSEEKLRVYIPRLVRHERKIMAMVLEYIADVDARRLYLKWGHASLFDYLVKELKYSESSANRRMSAARALQRNPEILAEVEDGKLNLSQITMAQACIRQEEKATGNRIGSEERKEIFASMKDLNLAATQALLDEKLPNHEPASPVLEKHRRDESVEVTLRIPKELYAKLKEVKDLYSHIAPGAGWLQLLDLMANDVKKARDPKREPLRRAKSVFTADIRDADDQVHSNSFVVNSKAGSNLKADNKLKAGRNSNAGNTKTRRLAGRLPAGAKVVPKPIRRFVFQRDHGKCQHTHADGSICGSTFQVEVDHITPRFAGGDDSIANLRLLCRAHNQARYREGAGLRRASSD